MAVSLRKGFCISCSGAPGLDKKKLMAPSSLELSPRNRELLKGKDKQALIWDMQAGDRADLSVHAQASSTCVPRSMRWWERGVTPNMLEIGSAQELVDSLRNAGDRLVVVDFYSPGCGGCRALHPKICQFAESSPGTLFLKVNYEEHKSMCYSLNVHVLPFFRFYRGAQGRVCSFSCTNATIQKFKDAMAKHGTEGRNLGAPAKGLEESELLKLASNRELHFNYPLLSSGMEGLAASQAGSFVGAAEVEEEMAALSL